MFDEEWLEFFKHEAPSAYYSIIFLQFLGGILSYLGYFSLFLILLSPLFMVYSGIKGIKIKLVQNKKGKKKEHKKFNEEKNSQDLYIKHWENKLKKKKTRR